MTRMSAAFPLRLTVPVVIAVAVNALNSSAILTAIAPISAGFRMEVSDALSLITVMYIASAVAQPVLGSAADAFGPRRTFMVGAVLLACAAVTGGTAASFSAVLVARVLIGVGTAAFYPSAIVILQHRSRSAGRPVPPRTLAALAIGMQVMAIVGLPLGGLLTGAFGWRSVFWINGPIAIALFVCAALFFPADHGRRALWRSLSGIDLGGCVLLAVALTTSALAIGALGAPSIVAAAIAATIWPVFVGWELRVRRPLLDLRMLWARPALARTLLRAMLTWVAMNIAFYGISQWLQGPQGYGPAEASLLLLPSSVVTVALAFLAAQSIRPPLVWGAALGCTAALLLLIAAVHANVWLAAAAAVAIGAMNGLTAVPNQRALLRQAVEGREGNASGLLRTSGHVGAIGATAVVAACFAEPWGIAPLFGLAVAGGVVCIAVLLTTALDGGVARH